VLVLGDGKIVHPASVILLRALPNVQSAAAAAPLLFIGGVMTAAELQSSRFRRLLADDQLPGWARASDSWVMTLTFALVGACDIVTGLALRAAARGRLVLTGVGACGLLVAAFPRRLGGSKVHAFWAGRRFADLMLWPMFARQRSDHANANVPWALRPGICAHYRHARDANPLLCSCISRYRTHRGARCQEGMANSPVTSPAVAGRGGTVIVAFPRSLPVCAVAAAGVKLERPAAPRRQARARTNELDAGKRRPMMGGEVECPWDLACNGRSLAGFPGACLGSEEIN
jgi:hypothetical protein